MTAVESLSATDKEFLAKCEEEFKDRYTDKDEEFMKVHSAEPSAPPIMETWWVSQNSGRRNDRRFNRRSHPYERNRDRRSRNDNEYENDNKDEGHRHYNRPRYNY